MLLILSRYNGLVPICVAQHGFPGAHARAQPHRRKAEGCGGKDSGDGGLGLMRYCFDVGGLRAFYSGCTSVSELDEMPSVVNSPVSIL